MFEAVVGHSDDVDTRDAVSQVLESCQRQLDGARPSAGLVFCGTDYEHHQVLTAIMEQYPGLHLIGCTTDGEMSSSGGFTEDAITLTLFGGNDLDVAAGYGRFAGASPGAAADEALAMARGHLRGDPKLAIVLPDGLTANAYRVLEGFNSRLGTEVPVVGGMSADRVSSSTTTNSTYQFYRDQVLTDAVPTLLFGGPLLYSLGVQSGWSPIGERATVTRSDGNVLYELDGKPAFELYTHYLGAAMKESLAGLGSYPLAVYEPGMDDFYLRVAKGADPETGAITFLGEVPHGVEVQITQAIRDEVIEGVNLSVDQAVARYPGARPGLAMFFSCTGRKIALGTRTRDEVDYARRKMGAGIPLSGFYTFGEIGPVADHARARYHNTTFVTLLLGSE